MVGQSYNVIESQITPLSIVSIDLLYKQADLRLNASNKIMQRNNVDDLCSLEVSNHDIMSAYQYDKPQMILRRRRYQYNKSQMALRQRIS